MKKSSKIRSVKTLILSQLLLGTLCASANTEAVIGSNIERLENIRQYFSERNPVFAGKIETINTCFSNILALSGRSLQVFDRILIKPPNAIRAISELKFLFDTALTTQCSIDAMLSSTPLDSYTPALIDSLQEEHLDSLLEAIKEERLNAIQLVIEIIRILASRPIQEDENLNSALDELATSDEPTESSPEDTENTDI
jgi:hypothetical protein